MSCPGTHTSDLRDNRSARRSRWSLGRPGDAEVLHVPLFQGALAGFDLHPVPRGGGQELHHHRQRLEHPRTGGRRRGGRQYEANWSGLRLPRQMMGPGAHDSEGEREAAAELKAEDNSWEMLEETRLGGGAWMGTGAVTLQDVNFVVVGADAELSDDHDDGEDVAESVMKHEAWPVDPSQQAADALVVGCEIWGKTIVACLDREFHHVAVLIEYSDGTEVCYDYGPMGRGLGDVALLVEERPGVLLIRPPPLGFIPWSPRFNCPVRLSRFELENSMSQEAAHRCYRLISGAADTKTWNCRTFAEWVLLRINAPKQAIELVAINEWFVNCGKEMQAAAVHVVGAMNYAHSRGQEVRGKIAEVVKKSGAPKLAACKLQGHVRLLGKKVKKLCSGGQASRTRAKGSKDNSV